MSQEISHVIIDPLSPGGGTSPPIDTTGANLIIFLVTQDFAAAFNISDSPGNTYSITVGRAEPSLNAKFGMFFLFSPITSASHTFTITGGGFSAGIVLAVRTAISLDATSTNNGVTASTTIQAGSVTASASPAMVVSGMCRSGSLTGVTVDSGFVGYDNPLVAAVHYGCSLAYKFQAAATAENPTFTSGGAADMASINVTFPMTTDGRTQGHVFG